MEKTRQLVTAFQKPLHGILIWHMNLPNNAERFEKSIWWQSINAVFIKLCYKHKNRNRVKVSGYGGKYWDIDPSLDIERYLFLYNLINKN